MKTSLILDDAIYQKALTAARKSGRTLSETISEWARLGHKVAVRRARDRRPVFEPVDLGPAKVNLDSRRDWMDELDS